MMRFRDLRHMLETEYSPDTTLGHFLVFRRGAPPAP